MKEFRLTQAQFGARSLMPAIDAVIILPYKPFTEKSFN
jgi:hypothetical protein